MSDRPADSIVRPSPSFWRGRRVLLTGQTGFKGAWAALWLKRLGATVTGLALPADGPNALFNRARIAGCIDSHMVDLRDHAAVSTMLSDHAFDIAIHLAAQPIVRTSIEDPLGTFASNVMGTANLLYALRDQPSLKVVLVITTDKVYANSENGRSFVETDPLGGKDPYAASKAAAEIVTTSFARTYFDPTGVRVATARGGNVIGGGDVSRDRLVADLVRAVEAGESPRLRHPEATRPWQHVLDCIAGYLVYVERLCDHADLPRAMNFGPQPGSEPVSVAAVAEAALSLTGWSRGWIHTPDPTSIEAGSLAIDTSLARKSLGFESVLGCAEAVSLTMEWHAEVRGGRDAAHVTLEQIEGYMSR